MNAASGADLRRWLRLRRQRELELLRQSGAPGLRWSVPENQASLTRVHDSAAAVLTRIDAAETAMRAVMQLWALDPARGGAHLLVDPPHLETAAPQDLHIHPTQPWGSDGELPITQGLEPWPLTPDPAPNNGTT